MSQDIVALIDKSVADRENKKGKNRRHLGGSVIGKPCARAIYYGWRWFHIGNHTGRLFRLWNRGHLEEFRFAEYLRGAGYEVRDYSQRLMYHSGSDAYITIDWDAKPSYHGNEADDQIWAECDDVSESRWHIERCQARDKHKPKDEHILQQYGFKAHRGHFAGNDDGRIRGPLCPDGWGLLEEKTYNEKRFNTLIAKGVLTSDITYYNQMQTYMGRHGLKWAFFIAVCKNDERLYVEIIHYKQEVADSYFDRAGKIIEAVAPPPRISQDPSWFVCKMCDYREICHKDKVPAKNCRTCVYSVAADDCRFYCNLYHNLIPIEFEAKGCDSWEPIG